MENTIPIPACVPTSSLSEEWEQSHNCLANVSSCHIIMSTTIPRATPAMIRIIPNFLFFIFTRPTDFEPCYKKLYKISKVFIPWAFTGDYEVKFSNHEPAGVRRSFRDMAQ